MIDVITGIILVVGAFFAAVAAIGILRLPDLYTRMHAASKAGTLGSGLLLLAIAIDSYDTAIVMRALAGIVFFLLTAPVAAHLLARSAYFSGLRPWSGTIVDEIAGHYDQRSLHLDDAETAPVDPHNKLR